MENIDLSKFNHQLELNVRFMDLDALQHVNNARYLNFLEEARLAYSQEKLNLFNSIKELNVLVARIEIDFIQPIFFGEKVIIYTRIPKVGTKSFTFECVICAEKDGNKRIVSRAIQILVAFDPVKKQSVEIPPYIKEKVKSIEKE